MTRQKYSKEEAIQRILRVWKGETPADDTPNSLDSNPPWNISLSDLAELFQGSLPNETLTLPDGINLSGPRVFAYLSTGTATTIVTGSLYYPIQGPFVNDPFVGFSVAENKIQYDGAAGEFEIDWSATIQGDANSIVGHIGVSVDGEILSEFSPSVMGTLLKLAGEPQAISGTDVVTLNTGSTIQLQVSADSDGDIITVVHFTTTLRRFV